jgi:hypothetical protein
MDSTSIARIGTALVAALVGTLAACASGHGDDSTTDGTGSGSAEALSSGSSTIGTCAAGLDVQDDSNEVACNTKTNPCAAPQLLCRMPSGSGPAAGKCVCDPRRMNDPSPGNPVCTSTGSTCVANKTACSNGGGHVRKAASCAGVQICCDGFISSKNDPGCAGAHKKQGSCIDADDNDLPDVCCK